MFACSRRIPASPAEAGFKPPYYRLQRNEDNRGLRPQDFFVPFFRKKYRSQSSTGGSFAAFWSAKSGAKTDPPTKKAKRRGLTLAPGDYSRVCKQTVPSARAFSPHLFERLFCQAGVVRRETRREKSAFSLAAEKEQPTARVPGAGGCIVLFLLHPLNAGRRLFPRKRHADGFGTFNFATLVFLLLARHSPQAVSARAACVGCHQKYREIRDIVAGVLYLFSAKRYPKTPRQMPSPTSSRLTLAPGARLKGGFKGRWAAERIISDTTLSLLKPASYAGARAFSRAFVSRLRHRAGIVRGNSVFSAGKRSEHANMRTGANISCSLVRGESRHRPWKRF